MNFRRRPATLRAIAFRHGINPTATISRAIISIDDDLTICLPNGEETYYVIRRETFGEINAGRSKDHFLDLDSARGHLCHRRVGHGPWRVDRYRLNNPGGGRSEERRVGKECR